jgi:hypothetical protein
MSQPNTTKPNTDNTWWHSEMNAFASKLPPGVLNEMKQRVLKSNIRKEKLALTENTQRMKEFFQREIDRYTKRKAGMRKRLMSEEGVRVLDQKENKNSNN